MCVICGSVGCGRYKDGHAMRHWKETQHSISLEVETQEIWDYVGDNYAHSQIQSKTDGKLVELKFHGVHADDTCGSCSNWGDSEIDEAIFISKLENISMEYNDILTSQLENIRKYFESPHQEAQEEVKREISKRSQKAVNLWQYKLHTMSRNSLEDKILGHHCAAGKIFMEYNDLTSQLENQRKHFESLLQKRMEVDEREISKAVQKAVSRLQKLQTKLNKSVEEKRFLEDINENLLKDEETWKTNIQHIEERERAAVKLKDEKIQNLEEQLQRLINSIGSPNTVDDLASSVIDNGVKAVKISRPESSSSSSSSKKTSSRRRNGSRRS